MKDWKKGREDGPLTGQKGKVSKTPYFAEGDGGER